MNTPAHQDEAVPPGPAPLSEADLPPRDTRRWVPRRKAIVVDAVRQGIIDRGEACRRYGLSEEEFAGWESAVDAHGLGGLYVTRLQFYRRRPAS